MTIPLRWLKTALLAAAWLLGAECVPAGAQTPDSIVRLVCRYAKENTTSLKGEEQNVYVKYDFRTMRRNPTLILVPTMYAIARGTRNYTGETYGRILFKEGGDYEIKPQIAVGTISSYRKIMPHLVKLLTPDIYGVTLLGQYMLSPFHPDNTRFYRYHIVPSHCASTPRPTTPSSSRVRPKWTPPPDESCRPGSTAHTTSHPSSAT